VREILDDAAILMRCWRMVADSAIASGSVCGMTACSPYEPERGIAKSEPHLIGAGICAQRAFLSGTSFDAHRRRLQSDVRIAGLLELVESLGEIAAWGVDGMMGRGTSLTDSPQTRGDTSPRRGSSRPMAVGARRSVV
jgi:hypothetical protein